MRHLPVKRLSSDLARPDALSKYLAEIARLPILSREEEFDLAMRWYRDKDRDAAQKLVVSNLRFVVKIAREYSKYGFKLSDLVQEGNMGLMHAVQKFDPTKGHRLISYAVWWIRAYMQSFVLRSWSIVRKGTTRLQRRLFSSLQRARRELAAINPQEAPSNKQLAEVLDMSEEHFAEELHSMQSKDVSLDQPVAQDSSRTLGENLEDESGSIEDKLIARDLISKVRHSVDDIYEHLKPRERYLLENRLLSDHPLTLEAVGAEFGVTRERVRQLESRLKDKIRQELEKTIDVNPSS